MMLSQFILPTFLHFGPLISTAEQALILSEPRGLLLPNVTFVPRSAGWKPDAPVLRVRREGLTNPMAKQTPLTPGKGILGNSSIKDNFLKLFAATIESLFTKEATGSSFKRFTYYNFPSHSLSPFREKVQAGS